MSGNLGVEEFEALDFREAGRRFIGLLPQLRKLRALPPPVLKYLESLLASTAQRPGAGEDARLASALDRLAREGKVRCGLPNTPGAYPQVLRSVPPGLVERLIDEDRDDR